MRLFFFIVNSFICLYNKMCVNVYNIIISMSAGYLLLKNICIFEILMGHSIIWFEFSIWKLFKALYHHGFVKAITSI